jgi:very-short-patch-repair endonuclease
MDVVPHPDWYLDNVLVDAEPAIPPPTGNGPTELWQAWWVQQAEDIGGRPDTDLAIGQGFVIGREQLRAFGWRDHDIRRVLRRAEWSRPTRGVISPVHVHDEDHLAKQKRHALRSCAAAVLRPDHVISGRSAAILHGLPTMSVPQDPVLTTWGMDSQGRRQGVHVRGASLDSSAVTTWFRAPVVTVSRNLVELARGSRRDGIMAADAALRASLVAPAEWEVELIGAAGWPGIRQARDVLTLADGAAESPLESIVRLALHDDGFPPPKLQFRIGDHRVDFCWPEYRLVLEADGRGKYTDQQLWREKLREARLRALGYRIERVLWSDVIDGWPAISRRLWALIRG